MRVIQLASFAACHRGARAHLLTVHERLLAGGHHSIIIDLARRGGILKLARLFRDQPPDVVHLHAAGICSWQHAALVGVFRLLRQCKIVCTLHWRGRIQPRHVGLSALLLRQFDALVANSPEVARFLRLARIPAQRLRLIAPLPRLRSRAQAPLSREVEEFCRRHTPLIVSEGTFEADSCVALQFNLLAQVRQYFPSAGLIALGSGNLHFRLLYERALHGEANHILLPGSLGGEAVTELVARAGVFLQAGISLHINDALRAGTPVLSIAANDDPELFAQQVRDSFRMVRPLNESPSLPELSDGVDEVIHLYRQLAIVPEPAEAPPEPVYDFGWGL